MFNYLGSMFVLELEHAGFSLSNGIYAGDGYCRSEAVVAVYLQKKESAKRIYATVVHSKSNSDGYKNIGTLRVNETMGNTHKLVICICYMFGILYLIVTAYQLNAANVSSRKLKKTQ